MLCLADELSRPENLRDDVIFRKIGMSEGVEMALDEKQLKEAVEWMRRVWSGQDKPPKKITQADRKHLLVYSRSAKYTPCPKKTVHFCFCQNFVKFPPTLIDVGR